jgi:hypothetical protein
MPQHTVRFEMKNPRSLALPHQLLDEGGKYKVEVRDGDVYVWGNRNGLLYLGEVLIRCAIGGLVDTFHVHIPQNSSQSTAEEAQDELLVFAADEKFEQ